MTQATVFGRHGGWETFDIEFVRELIPKIAMKRADIFFLLVNSGSLLVQHAPLHA